MCSIDLRDSSRGLALLGATISTNGLLRGTATRFDKFLENIKLTPLQKEDAKTKYDGVAKKLHDYFYNNDYTGSTKLLVGSYGKNTNIRPARDVDVFFKMPWSEMNQSSISYNAQSALLQRIKNILKEKYPSTDIRGDGQVVVVNFSVTHFVEVIPSFESTIGTDIGKFYIPDTSGGGKWKVVDPRAEIKQLEDSDAGTSGNTRNLTRMIKKWQQNCNVEIKSVAIELRSINFLRKYQYANKTSIYYDWMVRDFFKELIEFAGGNCKLPGTGEIIEYGDSWKSKAETAYARAVKACEFESKKDYYNATLEWKKIFGDEYYF